MTNEYKKQLKMWADDVIEKLQDFTNTPPDLAIDIIVTDLLEDMPKDANVLQIRSDILDELAEREAY